MAGNRRHHNAAPTNAGKITTVARHKAALNFGDCLAYASAVAAGDSLLFVGDGFALTDIRSA